jgi:F0F1-type ATP synthase membrane subunit b/b'
LLLQAAKEDAKKVYDKMVSDAKQEAEAIEEDLKKKLEAAEAAANRELDTIAQDWWNKILNDLK